MTVRTARLLALSSALLASGLALAAGTPNKNAYLESEPAARQPEPGGRRTLPNAVVSSLDPRRGVPNFLWASTDQARAPKEARKSPTEAARWYLTQHAARYRLSPEALSTAFVHQVHDTGRGGIIVTFHQRVDGFELYRNELNVLMTRDLDLVGMSGNLHEAAVPARATGRLGFTLLPEEAIAGAFDELYGIRLPDSNLVDTGRLKAGYRYFTMQGTRATRAAGVAFARPARIRPVYFPMPDRIVPAYYLEIFAGYADEVTSEAWGYVIAADDGRVLLRRDMVDDAKFKYTVWTSSTTDLRPPHGPMADYQPHPTGQADGSLPPYTLPNQVEMDGFNTNPSGAFDPWLADAATVTTGNNVDAYADINSPDGYSDGDIRPTTTSDHTFDRTYDVTQEPLASTNQSMAAVTQQFFVTNWLHDWYYDSGFDEAAGNAQTENFDRGGVEGDPLHAEGQDSASNSSTRNNANMSTPEDGESPRMQMYLWTGVTDAAVSIPQLGALNSGTAAFGPTEFNVTGNVVLVNDGTDTTSDGCETIRQNLSRKIALIDRGNCDFQYKALNAEGAGAIGVIIANNVDGEPPAMGAVYPFIAVEAATLSITLSDGNKLKDLLKSGTVSATLKRETGIERDGTIDNSVIAHEWGHYFHHRNVSCNSQSCSAMSEGWGDFTSMQMLIHEGDDLDGTYAIAIYASISLGTDAGYYGIRRLPYSTDFDKNGFTFADIQDGEELPEGTLDFGIPNSESHNAGEIWTTTLWEAYAGLIRTSTQGSSPRYTFDEVRRMMADYTVGGLKTAPIEPTFTEQRDAILASAAANSEADFLDLADGFARRGMGTCAVSPPIESTDLVGVVESYEASPAIQIVSVSLDDSVGSCDNDGYLDAEETGLVTVEVMNTGVKALADTEVSVSTELTGASFPDGSTFALGQVERLGVRTVTFPVALDGSLSDVGYLDLEVTVTDPAACNKVVVEPHTFRVNFDDVQNASATETVESETIVWGLSNNEGEVEVWSRAAESETNHVFHGTDAASLADGRLESPSLKVAATGSFVLSFRHRHQFETGPLREGGSIIYWDGGVIEVSKDDGASWTDVSTYADPGYNGAIGTLGSNPIAGQEAYVDHNPSWPAYDQVSLNLGAALAGKTAKVRFRLASDEAAGDYGWDIDDIQIQGITNLPFATLVADKASSGTFYADADGDGEGDPNATVQACGAPAGYVSSANDCDDTDSSIFPGADELCDGLDNDCDGEVDEDPTDGTLYYPDEDGDGHGTVAGSIQACDQPDGYASTADDCDDSDAGSYEGAQEICDGVDNDCDFAVDEGVSDGSAYYQDLDGDGYGAGDPVVTCDPPSDYVAQSGDCNDRNASTYPGAEETGEDGIDHNCDGEVNDYETPTPAGDDDSGGDDDSPSGDDDSGGDDDSPSGDDDSGGDDDSPSGDDDSGGDDDSDGDDDATGQSSPTPDSGDDASNCTCSQPDQPMPMSRSIAPLATVLVALAFTRMRRR